MPGAEPGIPEPWIVEEGIYDVNVYVSMVIVEDESVPLLLLELLGCKILDVFLGIQLDGSVGVPVIDAVLESRPGRKLGLGSARGHHEEQ